MMREISFEIEHPSGDTYMGFVLSIADDGKVAVTKTLNCSHADTDGDYLFNTKNELIRIQADWFTEPSKYEEMIERFECSYEENNTKVKWF